MLSRFSSPSSITRTITRTAESVGLANYVRIIFGIGKLLATGIIENRSNRALN